MRQLLLATLAAGLIAAVAAVVPIHRAMACTCAMFHQEQALANAEVAFDGVVADGPQLPPDRPAGGLAGATFTFAVQTVIKGGPLPERMQIVTADSGTACGAGFGVGQRWRVFAIRHDPDGPLWSGSCSGNELLAERAEIPPPSISTDDPRQSGGLPTEVLLAIGAAALLASASVVAFRRGPASRVR